MWTETGTSLLGIFIEDLQSAIPLVGWPVLAILVLSADSIFRNLRLSLLMSVAGLTALLVYSIVFFQMTLDQGHGFSTMLFFDSVRFDRIAQFLNLLCIGIVLSITLMSVGSFDQKSKKRDKVKDHFPEYLICLILGGFGAAVTVASNDLTSFFLGIETLSISIYALCGFLRWDMKSTESSLKYLIIGAFSTVLLLYGLSFLYGATGSTNFDEIMMALPNADPILALLALIFLMAGIGFKLALVPFHLYTPDVYEGAPTPVTAYMATLVKVAAIGGAYRLFWETAGSLSLIWKPMWLALCVLSIVIGNLAALRQRSLKKLLAFSSISHAGFLGLGLLVAKPLIVDSEVFLDSLFPLLSYLVVYCAMSIGIFGVVAWVEDRDKTFLVDDLRGLGLKRFWVGALFSIFALGMAGIPPFAGFMIKFVIFQELLSQGYLWAAIFGVLGSIIGAGYYLRILMLLFMSDDEGAALQWPGITDRIYALRFVLVFTTLLTVVGGIRPSLYSDWILLTLGIK